MVRAATPEARPAAAPSLARTPEGLCRMARLLLGRAIPKPRRAMAAPLAATLVLASACGSGDERIDDPKLPYSFSYPSEFETGEQASVSARESGFDNETLVAKKNGRDLIAVQTQPLRRPVSPKLVPRVKREVEQGARRTGKVRAKRDVRVGALDAVAFDMTLRGEAGVPIGARWVYAAKDRTLFWVNCQWRSDRPAVLAACDEVLRSFRAR
jgi:hypothetical protein